MMITKYIEQLLDVYNYIDSIFIVDKQGRIEYYKDYKLGMNDFTEQEIIGKHILEVYPELTNESSAILNVLRTGEPIVNVRKKIKSYKGKTVEVITNTIPITLEGEIIGVADVSKYVEDKRDNATLNINYSVDQEKTLYSIDDIISVNPTINQLKSNIVRVSRSDSSVLIFGETGTGKELVAQSIHTHSMRSKHRFISQNCAAIPSALLESLFFGTVKGSYTGAENTKGLFELADHGTIFLDEINSMDILMQSKILKVIEDQKFKKVGGQDYIEIDVRVISALNEDPLTCIENSTLRADLFYRLSVVQFVIPPLRQRKGDIELLTNYFLNDMSQKLGRSIQGVSEEVANIFNSYEWRGNIRELKNVIEGCVNISESNFIQKQDLPGYLQTPYQGSSTQKFDFIDSASNLKEKMETFEKHLIIESMNKSRNRAQAAAKLKISRQALNYKLNKYDIK